MDIRQERWVTLVTLQLWLACPLTRQAVLYLHEVRRGEVLPQLAPLQIPGDGQQRHEVQADLLHTQPGRPDSVRPGQHHLHRSQQVRQLSLSPLTSHYSPPGGSKMQNFTRKLPKFKLLLNSGSLNLLNAGETLSVDTSFKQPNRWKYRETPSYILY